MTRHVDLLTSIANTIEPVWMHQLPNHTFIETSDVAKMFGVTTWTVLVAFRDGRIPPPINSKIDANRHSRFTYRWTLGTLRKFMRECREERDSTNIATGV